MSFVVNISSIVGMIVIATVTLLSGYNKQKIYFAAAVYISSIWLLLQYVVQLLLLHNSLGLLLIEIDSGLAFVMAFHFYAFTKTYVNKTIPRWFLIFSLVFFIVEFSLHLSSLMIQDAWGDKSGVIINQATHLYLTYIIIVGLLFAVSIFELVQATIKAKAKKDKIKNLLLVFAFLQSILVLIIFSIFFQTSASTQMLAPVSLLIMSIIIGLAIVRYQLFDVRQAVVRTTTYLLVLATLSIIYYYLAYIVSLIFFKGDTTSSISFSPVNIALALLLAFIFQPVKKFFDRITNRLFYKDRYDRNVFYEKLNATLSVTTDLRGLLERAAYVVGSTLKAEQAFFFVYTNADGHFITAGTEKHKQMPKHDAIMLEQKYDDNDDVVVASILDTYDPVRRMMVSHKLELILPLIQEGEVIGYLCLGDHMTSHYTTRDVHVLHTIANELIIAIQNALSVQEIRELNSTLQQRINNATQELRSKNAILTELDKVKDEFISLASHQLRTPLTSVKGYLSMVLEGDTGKISNSQRQLLNEAFMSSERMVHLINDFLNVSRIQTGKFIIDKTPVDLAKVVAEEIDALRPNAAARGMQFVLKTPRKFPLIEIDEGKIRQVIMNFADNAIYYSHENSVINVSLAVEGKDVVFKVKDSGIGVPVKERQHLFTKFFRASNAKVQRPDGTGVGIYLAKKVVDALDGQIIFESVANKGSTFGFRLPLPVTPVVVEPQATTTAV